MLHPVLLFLNIGTPEMILILFVALMLFGGDKLPQLAKGLGKGIRDFKDASEGVKREIHNQINNYEEKDTPAVAPVPDQNLPVVANTVALSDPFAPQAEPAEHDAGHNEHHEGALAVINQHNDAPHVAVAPATESYADVAHLISANKEVTHVTENHISISHVSDEPKAEEKPVKTQE